MPNVEDVKLPYEILIRFGDDGLPKGAHAQFIRRILIDGELIKEEIGNAEPLDLEGLPTSGLMSNAARDALAEVTRLNATVATLNAEANVAANAAELARQQIADLEQALADAGAQQKALQADLAAQAERAMTAESALAAAETQISLRDTALAAAQARIAELEAAAAVVESEPA